MLTLSRLGFSARSSFGKPPLPFKLLLAHTAGVITLLSHAGLVVPALHGKSMSALKIDAHIEDFSGLLPEHREPIQVLLVWADHSLPRLAMLLKHICGYAGSPDAVRGRHAEGIHTLRPGPPFAFRACPTLVAPVLIFLSSMESHAPPHVV